MHSGRVFLSKGLCFIFFKFYQYMETVTYSVRKALEKSLQDKDSLLKSEGKGQFVIAIAAVVVGCR